MNQPEYPDIIGSWDDQTYSEASTFKKIKNSFEPKFGKILAKFPILHHGWEGDCYGYVVEKESKKLIIMTDHGVPYISDEDEINSKLSEYQNVIKNTQEALCLLKS